MTIQPGDIVAYKPDTPYGSYPDPEHPLAFYVEEVTPEGGLTMYRISRWLSWCIPVPPEHVSWLEILDHVEPFEIVRGPNIRKNGNFLPDSAQDTLKDWIPSDAVVRHRRGG